MSVISLPVPCNTVTRVEHVEGTDARERRLSPLAIDEILLRGEADFAKRRLFQIVDAVGVAGEIIGEQGLSERGVEVLHRVFEHVDEAVDDDLGVCVSEAECL